MNEGLPVATSKARLMIYLDQETKEQLEKLAELDGRTMSNFTERLILEAIANAKSEGKV